GQVETEQGGRGVGVGREHYATLVQPGSVAALCTLGSHLETETRQPGAELPGGESWRLGADPLQDAVGRFGADTPNTVDEDPGATQIDVSAFEQVGHGPMTPQISGELHLGSRGSPGQVKCGGDLGSCRLLVSVDPRDLADGAEPPRLDHRDQPVLGAEQVDQVERRYAGPIDREHDH